MSRKYAIPFELAAVATTYKTAGLLVGGTTSRPQIYELSVGQGGTPADNAIYWQVSRQTAAGTITSVTPRALDSTNSVVAVATAGSNATVEGTITASSDLITVAINQRASFRWVAAPGNELIVPATAANGLAVLTKSAAYTGVGGGYVHFEE